MKQIEKAIKYVRDNVDIDAVKGAIVTSMQMRMPVGCVAPALVYDITDLLEEYGQDNDLPEMWWAEFYDIDEIIEML